jgi:hypothetical protein
MRAHLTNRPGGRGVSGGGFMLSLAASETVAEFIAYEGPRTADIRRFGLERLLQR